MSNYTKVYLFLTALLFGNYSLAKIHEYETTHLKSAGGSGVGSLLLEESAFLNPASLVFLEAESIYYQHDSIKSSDSINTNYPAQSNNGFVLSQGSPGLSGTVSYITQREDNTYRKRWGFSLAAQIAAASSLGFSIRDTKDSNATTAVSTKYYQSVLGVTHAISEQTSLGVMAYDVFKSKGDETKIILGIHQTLLNYISGALDFGADYTAKQISKKTILRGSIQVKLLDDFFLRFGAFSDKIRAENGEGFGLAWIQPKLSFELAIKNTRSNINRVDKTNRDTSFSVSLRGF
jgi:hypothetical protein